MDEKAVNIANKIADKFPEFFDIDGQDYSVLERLEDLCNELSGEWISVENRESVGWLITRFFPFGQDTKEVVIGALTDDHALLEGDEAVPLFIVKDE